MDLLSTHACLYLLADLRLTGNRVDFIRPRQDRRSSLIQIDPGWLTLVGEMLERLLLLPLEEQPNFEFIRALDGKLEISWRGVSIQGDMILIATKARAEHICQWCGARGRYLEPQRMTLCLSHAALSREKKVSDITPAERLQPGKSYSRRQILVDVVVGKRTVSGLTAAVATETGEHGFEPADAHMPAAFLNGAAAEADLVALDIARVGRILDHGIFGMVGAARSFQIGDALPAIVEAARCFDLDMSKVEAWIADTDHFDPDIRAPSFRRLAKLIEALDELEAVEI